jgi:hypothetical protein
MFMALFDFAARFRIGVGAAADRDQRNRARMIRLDLTTGG